MIGAQRTLVGTFDRTVRNTVHNTYAERFYNFFLAAMSHGWECRISPLSRVGVPLSPAGRHWKKGKKAPTMTDRCGRVSLLSLPCLGMEDKVTVGQR
jgi:hypothetical protein